MSSQPEALSDWNILPEDLDCEKNPFLQMSQDQIQKLDAVLSSEQARALLRESSNDRLFSESDKLDDVLSSEAGVHDAEDNKLPAVLEETLGVSLKDLEHLVLDTSAGSELFPEAAVSDMSADILDMENQIRSLSLAVWLDHSYSLQPPPTVLPVVVTEPVAPPPVRTELVPALPVLCEVIDQSKTLTVSTETDRNVEAAVNTEADLKEEKPSPDNDQESVGGRAGPRRRSQRQIEKITREQVEKIRAENAEMERKEREEMERMVTEEKDPKTEDESSMNELEAVKSELSKEEEPKIIPQEIQQETKDDSKLMKVKEVASEKRKRKKSHNSESEGSSSKSKSRNHSELSIEKPKIDSGSVPKSPKSGKEGGKTKRHRTSSLSLSPTKKVEEDEAEQQKQSEEKSPSLEKKKKKVKREKSYEEGPEPALFSLPDKMIKRGNDCSPDLKPQRKPSISEKNTDLDQKKTEPTTKTVKPDLNVVVKKEVAQSVKEGVVTEKDKLVKIECVPTSKPVQSAEMVKTAVVAKTNKKESEVPGKVIKRTSSTEQKVKKPSEVVVKDSVPTNGETNKNQVNSVKVSAEKHKVSSTLPKIVKPPVLTNSDPNVSVKPKHKVEVKQKTNQGVSKSPVTKSSVVRPVHKVKQKTGENHRGGSKTESKNSKNKSGVVKDGSSGHGQVHREKRTIKKKPLHPNEIHPDEASDPEDYSDDPNDSDWDSEDDPEKLWCICKQPSNDRFMIQCDPCSNWFHGTCVGVTRQQGRQMEKDGVEWHCPQCSKGATKEVLPTVSEPAKTKPPRKEIEVKPPRKEIEVKPKQAVVVKSIVPSSSNTPQCIVCKSPSKKDSVYCGEACIEQHVKEVLKLLQSSETKPDANQIGSINPSSSARVVVMERWTGKLYTGPNAPTQDGLMVWLKANPTFEALKPGPSLPTSSKKPQKTSEKEDKPGDSDKKDPEPVRLNVRKTLKEILLARCKGAEDVKCTEDAVGNLSQKIEEELYKLFKDTNSKYKSKYRSLMFNVKDPRNQGLFRKIVNQKIVPYRLVRMSPEELASKELAKWRERENQHALDMIKKDQLENQHAQSLIIKKTHKGEVEIEDDNLSILEQRNEERPENKEEDMSDIKAMLADTTSEHKMHLFDLNCQICSGRKAVSEVDAEKASPEKRKIKVARTISLERPNDSLSKDGPVVVAPKIVGSVSIGQKNTREKDFDGKDKKNKKARKKVAVMDEPSDHEPTSTVSFGSPNPELRIKSVSLNMSTGKPSVWKGFIFMLDVTKFVTSAHKVSGPTGSLSQEIPDTVQVCGRIPPEEVWSYLSKIKQGGTKELIVMRFQPANDEEKGPYEAFYNYLNSRKRYGVVRNSSKMIKDFYIIPLGSHNPVPTVLMPFDGPGLDSSRPNLLLGVIVRHKNKSKVVVPVPAPVPVVEKYDHAERSYTPPLDALPCQSTTVDSSISTSGSAGAAPISATSSVPKGAPQKSKSPSLSPAVNVSSPTNVPGILSPSTLIPSSLIASILAPKLAAAATTGKGATFLDDKPGDAVKNQSAPDDEPYEPSYTPPLENATKLDEDKPYDPDDLDDLEVQPKLDVRSFLDAPSPSASNADLAAQKKLLAELTRQVEEQKEQIEMQKTQVLEAAKNKQLCLDNSDILLPEMLQDILKNIRAKSGQGGETAVSDIPGTNMDITVGNPIPVTVKPTSLSSMSAKELVERAQRELADLQREGIEGDRPPPVKKIRHVQSPIPTIGDSSSLSFPPSRTHPKAEPPPPGVDVEEMVTDYNNPSPFYPTSSSHQPNNPYPSLAPPFQQTYYQPPPPPPPQQRDSYHQGPPPMGQPPPHAPPHAPPPPLPPPQQHWGLPSRDSGPPPPWPVTPPGDPYYQGGQWGGPWNQPPPPPPPVGWNDRPPWNPSGQDTDARDSDLRMFQRRNIDRHYNRDRKRK